MYRLLVPLAIVLFVSACGSKEEAAVTVTDNDDIDLIVRCGTLIDGLADTVVTDRAIVIRRQRVTEILPGDDASLAAAEILDLRDHTCLPGLIDMHVHVDGYPEDADDYNIYLRRTPEETKQIAAELGEVILKSGFTTARNVGTYKAWVARDLRDQIEAGEVIGPRLRVAGPYLTIPHGGGDMYIPGVDDSEIPDYYRMGVARGADEFRARAQANVDGGADFIKIIASGAVFGHGGVPGAPEMTFEEIVAVVEVAKAAGIKVTAHAHSAESIKDAILAGVDSIEHASLGDDESVALAVEHGVAFSMDVYNGTYTEEMGETLGYAPEFMRKNEETTEAQRIVFRKALAAGVTLVFGTDLGVLPHDMGTRQLEEMVKHGMQPMHAIKSATSIAADHMELSGDVGAVAPGRYGDLIAVRGNPLKDISVLQKIEVVIKGGDIVKNDSKGKFADAVYHTGKIYTVNPEQPWAQAVAVTAGKISFVGSDDRARALIGPHTKTIDLRGKMMLPGFQDAHVHALSGGLQETSCNLGGKDSLAAYRSIISQCAANDPDGEWITGGGWSMSVFGPGAKAGKGIIDELVSDRPVYLDSADGHTGWANSKALEIAGITKDTPDPSDGIIDRDPETGEPIGSLQEGAMALMGAYIPPPTHARRMQALEYTRDLMHSLGITSFQSGYMAEEDLKVYQALDNAGELNMRVVASLRWDNHDTEEQLTSLVELRQRYLRGNIRPTSVKIFIDGVMENYTALMLEPYLVESGTQGIPMIDPGFLPEAVSQIAAAGFQVHFHALGDGAVRMALDSIEESNRRNGDQDLRHHLVHLQVIHPDDIPRFRELGAVANFQMQWAMADPYITELTLPFISEETARWIYPIKSVIDAGGKIAMGSDWTVSTVDPLPQIETAVTRIEAIDHATAVLNPEQRISLAQAVEGFTMGSAFVNHQDDTTGSIEVGKLADLIVLDKNLFALEPHEISDAKVLLTLFEGKAVYGNLD
jgi:predicted amidohydrolase YtcJ